MSDEISITSTKVEPTRRPPKRTRCGGCDAKVPLNPKRWYMATDEAGEPFFWNQVECRRCGHSVVAICIRSVVTH